MLFTLLLVVLVAWAALPFLPAFLEMRHGVDATSLPVGDVYREDLSHQPVAADPFIVETDWHHGRAPRPSVVVNGTVTTPRTATFDTLRASGDIRLGAGTTVRQWLETEGTLVAEPQANLHGSASAKNALILAPGCQFERIHAPVVRAGEGTPDIAPVVLGADLPVFDPPRVASHAGGRRLVRGDLTIPARTLIDSDLVVTGALYMSEGSVVKGSLTCHGDLTLGEGARIEGNAFSHRHMQIGPGAHVVGAASARARLYLASGSRVGRQSIPATATGAQVLMEEGAIVYGTVWATERGLVRAAPPSHGA